MGCSIIPQGWRGLGGGLHTIPFLTTFFRNQSSSSKKGAAEPSPSTGYQYCCCKWHSATFSPLRDRAAICSSAAIQLACELEGETEANVVVAVRRPVIVAIGGAAVLRVVVPAAAAVHAVRCPTMTDL